MPKYSPEQLVGFLAAWDNSDLPDGAWWAVLEEGAEEFIKEHKLTGVDANDIVHEYVEAVGTKGE